MNDSNREQLVSATRRASQLLEEARKALESEFPGADLVLVLSTNAGLAVATGKALQRKDQAYEDTAMAQQLLRRAAESCGRVLYQSPDQDRAFRDSQVILVESQKQFERWAAGKCAHADCSVREAAVYVATGRRILESIGAPVEVLNDLTGITKEACRRTHLKILEQGARGSA